MRITRRLREPAWLERRSRAVLVFLASLSSLGAMTASCSSTSSEPASPDAGDLANDGAVDTGALADVTDAGVKDAALVDATPLAIECVTPPCAVALTTTMRGTPTSREEGYCVLLDDGTVACWGANGAGQLGNGTTGEEGSTSGVRVPGLSGIVSIDHTCAVDKDGAVWCWGYGPFLQNDAASTSLEASPVRLPLPGPVDRIAVESTTACALLRDRSVVCWGSNSRLQVDMNESESAELAPRTIALPTGVKSLAIGYAAFAISEDGKISSWGQRPTLGRLTPLSLDGWPSPVPLDHVTMVDTIDEEACAVANGVGWCWGAHDGQTLLARALPIAVDTPEPITRIATSRTWHTVEGNLTTTFELHRWCATSVAGNVYCRGLNNAGQAGDGTKEFALEAVRVAGLPAPAAEVKVMPRSTCAILTNGRVDCWGNNFYGQLGAGLPKGAVLVPTEVVLP